VDVLWFCIRDPLFHCSGVSSPRFAHPGKPDMAGLAWRGGIGPAIQTRPIRMPEPSDRRLVLATSDGVIITARRPRVHRAS